MIARKVGRPMTCELVGWCTALNLHLWIIVVGGCKCSAAELLIVLPGGGRASLNQGSRAAYVGIHVVKWWGGGGIVGIGRKSN